MRRPSREEFIVYRNWFIVVSLLFFSTYPPAALMNSPQNATHLYFQIETALPLMESFIWIYATLYFFFFLPLFICPKDELHALGWQLSTTTIMAGFVFWVFPTTLGFPPTNPEKFEYAFHVLRSIDKPLNLFPSLHIAYGFLLTAACTRGNKRSLKTFFGLWYGLLILSVLFTHQHHIADIFGGFIIALTAKSLELPQVFRKTSANQISPYTTNTAQ